LQGFWDLTSSPKMIAHVNQYMQKQNKHTNQSKETLHHTSFVQNGHTTMQKQRFNARIPY
jgi:hypothetical protein